MPFDPYSELLGLPPGPRPPSPEQLIGVQPGETDEQAILVAASRQNGRLKAYALREWADIATRLQREVGIAVVELIRRAAETAKTTTLSPASHQPPAAEAIEVITLLLVRAEEGTSISHAGRDLPDARPAPRPKPPARMPEPLRPVQAPDRPLVEKRLPSGGTSADLGDSASPRGEAARERHIVVRGITSHRRPPRPPVSHLILAVGTPVVGIFLLAIIILSLNNSRRREVSLPKLPPKEKAEAPIVPPPPSGDADKEAADSAPEEKTKVAEEPPKGPLDRGPVVRMPPRLAVPSENEQRASTASLQRDYDAVFSRGFSEKDEEYRARLPRDLYRLASSPRIDDLCRFVLLDLTSRNAVLSGNGVLALQAAEDLTLQFRLDAMKVKRQVIESLASVYRGRTYLTEDERRDDRKRASAVAWPLVYFAEEAMGERSHDTARRVCKSAADLGFEYCDEALRRRFATLSASVERAFAQPGTFLEALVSVKQNADDPEASWVAGHHLCLVLDKWHEGLPYLAHVADENIRGAATLELDPAPKRLEQQIVIAERWRRAAQSREGTERKGLLLRAVGWYRGARAGLDGSPLRGKVDQSLQESLRDLARLAAIPPVEPARRVGHWSPRFIAQGSKILRWDITPLMNLPGKYAVWFQCCNFAEPLYIEWVALGQNGNEIIRRNDRTVAESGRAWAQYTIELETPDFGKQYGLYARVLGGTASYGCVWLKYLGPP